MENTMRRGLGLLDSTFIGVGGIVGAGIFVVIGAAAGLAGPALLLSLVIGAVIAILTGLSFAQLSSRMPKEGGGYEYAYRLISPYAGFASGWLWIVSNIVVGSAVGIGFANYFVLFVPLPVKAVAVSVCLIITLVNCFGVKSLGFVNNSLVSAKILVLFLFVLYGLGMVDMKNFNPFFPTGYAGVMQGAALIFFAYAGFARIAIVGEEIRKPEKVIPKAIILSISLSTILYLLVGFVSVGLIGYANLSSTGSPLAAAAQTEGGWMRILVALGALAATLSVLLTTLLGLSRISYAMARNRDLPSYFLRIDNRSGIPYLSVLILGLLMAVFAAFFDLRQAVEISNFAILANYALMNFAAMRLNKPLYPRILPAVGLLSCIGLLFYITPESWIIGIGAMSLGTVYYLLKERRKKRPT